MNPWAFELHPEVLALTAFLVGAYVYLVRVIGPLAVADGARPVSRNNIRAFVAAIALFFFASWWPLHDISEDYLYSAHMLQHMIYSYFLPPLLWLATPEWLARTLIGRGRLYKAVSWFAKPVVAGVIFNGVVMLTHIPGLVNMSATNGPLHYSLHVLVVVSSLLMWLPVCGPLPELRIGPMATMIYLFLQSVVPTIPAGWLTFAEGTVYSHYGDIALRLWGIDVTADQQLAGVIMKTGGTVFLWTIIVTLWIKRFAVPFRREEHDYRRSDPAPLTFADVEREFAASEPPHENV